MGDEVDQTILATPAAGLPQGQSVAAAPTAPQAQQQATPAEGATGQYITVEQARAMVDDAVRRGMQSTTDRVTDRLTKQFTAQIQQIDARVAELRNAGVIVPQAEIDQAKAQVVRQALSAEPQGVGSQQHPQQQGAPDWVWGEIEAIGQETGVSVEETDPEAAMVVMDKGPRALIRSYEDAAKAKANRVKNGGNAAPMDPQQSALRTPALGGGGGAANPIGDVKDPASLIRMGLARK